MFRKMIPLAVAITLALGCSKKKDEGDPNATYTLKFRDPQQGEKYEVTVAETSEMDMGGKGDKMTTQKKYEYTEHILEMPAGEKQPTKLTRAYKVAQRTDFDTKHKVQDPRDPTNPAALALYGVVLSEDGGSVDLQATGLRRAAASAGSRT